MKIKQKIILVSLSVVFILFADNGYSESIREKLIKARRHEQQMRDEAAAERKKADNAQSIDGDENLKKSIQEKRSDIEKKLTKQQMKNIKNKKVELYVASWCPFCVKAEDFLKSKNIKFKKYDIERNVTGKLKYKRLKREGIPIVKINKEIIEGYKPDLIWKTLKE